MMTSLFTGVSGMQANQTYLDVISNNVSNSNTVGYKAEQVTFSEVLNQTISGASAPDASGSYGGTNPMQMGLGVGVASITTNTSAGSLQMTGNPTDMAIDGDGYFVIQNTDGTYMYTRSGNFGIDEGGNLVTADGLCVCGWSEYTVNDDGTYTFNTSSDPTGINLFTDDFIANKSTLEPNSTSLINLTGNLDSSVEAQGIALDDINTTPATPQVSVPMTACDELGNEYDLDINLSKCYVDESDPDNPVTSWFYEVTNEDGSSAATGYLKFDESGQIIDETGFEATPDITISDSTSGTTDVTFELDLSGLSMYNSESTAYVLSSDGNTASELVDYTIGQDGIILGVYDTGETQPLGCISLANFSNPAGLEKVGNNLYTSTANSGEATSAYQPGTESVGSLSVGYLEMSNVDLSNEFSQMIIAQRGYQANSQIITTADEMLQTLII